MPFEFLFMRRNSLNRKLNRIVALVVASGVLLNACATAPGTLPDAPQTTAPFTKPAAAPSAGIASIHAASPDVTHTVNLPIAMMRYPLQNVFGTEYSELTTEGGLDKMAEAGNTWARRNALTWNQVEQVKGQRLWQTQAALEQDMINASAKNINTVLIVRSVPTWAQKIPGSACGPVAPSEYAAFAQFLKDAVARYSQPPYNVKYWEIWNEPDIDVSQGDNVFGCMGNSADAYYGGGEYANLLKAIYPEIKAANPQASVLLGGMLLYSNGKGCVSNCPGKWLEGILRNGGGNFFEGISFHAYDFYMTDNIPGHFNSLSFGTNWKDDGPVVIAKAKFLQSVLSTYNVTGKYLMNTEGALICGDAFASQPHCKTPEFQTAKAYYAAQMYAATLALNLRATLWYAFYGWRGSAIADGTPNNTTPVYTAIKVSRAHLQDAQFKADINVSGLRGYEFTRGNRKLWVVWSADGDTHNVSLTPTPVSIQDALGNVIAPANSIDVTLKPLYIEWNQ